MARAFSPTYSTCAVVLLGVLAYLLYTPMPEGIEDPYRVMMVATLFKLTVYYPQRTRELLGYGAFYDRMSYMQETQPTVDSIGPISSWMGGMNVTRTTIAGHHAIVYRHLDRGEGKLRPGLIYIHGGGFYSGLADVLDLWVYNMALRTGSVAINFDYRRTPQHPFPAAFDDAVAVIRTILRHGATFGIDVTRVGVAGDSTGGNLAASAALHITKNDLDLPPLRYQVLMYPVTQCLDLRLPSFSGPASGLPFIDGKKVGVIWSLYLGLGEENGEFNGDLFRDNRHVSPEFLSSSKYAKYINISHLSGGDKALQRTLPTPNEPHNDTVFQRIKNLVVDPRLSPLMADDLSGLPETFVAVQEFDVLRDDGLLYAKRLNDSGVRVTLHHGQGFHVDHVKLLPDFLQPQTGLKVTNRVAEFIVDVLRKC